MTDDGTNDHDAEFVHRFILTCVALDASKAWLQTQANISKNRMNHYLKRNIPPRKPFARIAKALHIEVVGLEKWLIHDDISGLTSDDKDKIRRFEMLSTEEQTTRANLLGWLLGQGRPPKLQPPE
jgi:hypothetical protein